MLVAPTAEQLFLLQQNGEDDEDFEDAQLSNQIYECQIEDCLKQFPDQSSFRKH